MLEQTRGAKAVPESGAGAGPTGWRDLLSALPSSRPAAQPSSTIHLASGRHAGPMFCCRFLRAAATMAQVMPVQPGQRVDLFDVMDTLCGGVLPPLRVEDMTMTTAERYRQHHREQQYARCITTCMIFGGLVVGSLRIAPPSSAPPFPLPPPPPLARWFYESRATTTSGSGVRAGAWPRQVGFSSFFCPPHSRGSGGSGDSGDSSDDEE